MSLRIIVTTLVVWLLFSGSCPAGQVFMTDGSTLDCEWVRKKGDEVVVKVNRDVVLEFANGEVDVARTFGEPGKQLPKQLPKKAKKRKRPAANPRQQPAHPGTEAKKALAKPPPAWDPAPPEQAAQQTREAEVPAPAHYAPPFAPPAPATRTEAKGEAGDPESPSSSYLADREDPQEGARKASEMMSEAVEKHDPRMFVRSLIEQKKAMEEQRLSFLSALEMATGPLERNLTILFLCTLPVVGSLWVLFGKAGRGSFSSVIPLYNLYVLVKVSGRPGWWALALFVPVIGLLLYLLTLISLARRFGKSGLFGLGLFLLPMLFFPVLAFNARPLETAPPPVLTREIIDQIKAAQAQKRA